ncbi:MAG: YggS family pyridoxal phosphate-dependent enzyme [Christensenellales bacterium]
MDREDIETNLAVVKQNIAVAKQGIEDYDVKIIAVTKTKPIELIETISKYNLFEDVGENYVQELVAKYPVAPNLKWHMIGQLQSNKVKYIIDKVCLIHSLDRESLAQEIDKQARKRGIKANCLIEINMGSEISKGGIDKENLQEFADLVDEKYPNIALRGIMAIMPNLGECEELKNLYIEFRALFDKLQKQMQGRQNIDVLSCGMTNDYGYAIKYAQPTYIRIGRALFGARL